jgi:hypothetical protein
MLVTLYGFVDNSPPGKDIALPRIHSQAGGTGSFQDPETFATDQKELAPGTIVYYPFLQKYFIMEDECDECDQDWESHGPDGGPNLRHIDLWAGGDGNSISNPEKTALLNCEDDLTRTGQVIVNPPSNLPVDSRPVFASSTLACQAHH